MRTEATAVTMELNVHYKNGLSSQTGESDGSADIVTCSQSLHSMEPEATFEEIARILRPGGVFAAYDCDWPPTTGVWQADQAYETYMKKLSVIEERDDAEHQVRKWAKHEHLKRMTMSNHFRYTKEIVLHQGDEGNADRFVGVFLSQGGIRSLLKSGHTEVELGIEAFRNQCHEMLGDKNRPWYWSYRVRIGIK